MSRAPPPIRVVLTGAECSGKTTLAAHLAGRFGAPLALEYARWYLERHGPAYDYPLLRRLCRCHEAWQRRRVPARAPLGVFDTDTLNYKIWCDVVYGRCHPEIRRRVERERRHVYLLCAPDLPWEYDPLRENPNDREQLFERHRREIERLGRPCIVISGRGEIRYRRAEAAFRRLTGREAPGAGTSAPLG